MKRFSLIIITPIIFIILAISISFVIATQKEQVYKEFVVIDAGQKEVWDYLSDNSNAKMWSIFFDHISTLETTGSDVAEGGVGSVRRCFRNSNEQGISWDEVTVKTEPYHLRQIHTYNIQNWPLEDFNVLEFDVYQTYEKLGKNNTKLGFTASLKSPQTAYAKWLFYISKWETLRVFKVNLENIKVHIERGQMASYDRPHKWEPRTKVEVLLEPLAKVEKLLKSDRKK